MRLSHRKASLFSLRGQRKVIKRKAARRLALRVPCASRSGEGFSARPSTGSRDARRHLAAPVRTCSLLKNKAKQQQQKTKNQTQRYYPMQSDLTAQLQAQARDALAREAPLRIAGGVSLVFLGRAVVGVVLDVTAHRGFVFF